MRIHEKKLSFLLVALLSASVFFSLSSYSANAQLTPYTVNGTANGHSTVWHNIYNVNQNDVVLISLTKSSDNYYSTVDLFYPNQTEAYHSYYTYNHIFQFVAPVSGTYLLRLTSADDSSISYNISSSHPFDASAPTTPTPIPTVTPTSSPTATPTSTSSPISTPTSSPTQRPSSIPPVSTSAGDSVTFAAPSSYVTDNNSSNFIWDFGDGTSTTTNETTTTHTYTEAGNFTVTLRVQGAVGEKIIQTYGITVTPKTNDFTEALKIVIPLLAATITAGVSLYIYGKNRKTKNGEKMNHTEEPPTPQNQTNAEGKTNADTHNHIVRNRYKKTRQTEKTQTPK